MNGSATIFDVLNARYVAPDKIAETFIPHSQFKDLMRPGNSVLVGARGTGKTTLLKMLKMPAMHAWQNAQRDQYLDQLTYISAFVANDRNWSARINDFARQFESLELQRYARLAIVSNQALRAIVRSAAEIFHEDGNFTARLKGAKPFDGLAAEIQFARRISMEILQTKALVSAADIEQELGRRVDRFIQDTNAMRFAGDNERSVAQAHRWIFSEFLAPLYSAVNAFRDSCGISAQWCLCFDELELAHGDTRDLLYTYLRGADPVFYFKLATVPFVEEISAFQVFNSQNAPTVQHDFSVIELWNVRKDQGDEFMYELAESTFGQRGLRGATLETVLGNSFEGFDDDSSSGRYSRGSKFFTHFIELADHDETFRAYLTKRNIGVHDFYVMSEERRAAIFRKIQNIVVIRNAFFSVSRPGNVKTPMTRRRKSRGFAYSGAQNIVDSCDNNPRFLLAVLEPLISEYRKRNSQVPPEIQLEAITQVSNQVSAVLRGQAVHPEYARLRTVRDLVEKLGRFFREEIHVGPFNPDPVLSFTIPPDAPASLMRAVGFAIREGAMLLEGSYTGSYLRDGLADKRVRLAYLFASEFQLPIMLGRPRHVEGILRSSSRKRRQGTDGPDLFTKARHD